MAWSASASSSLPLRRPTGCSRPSSSSCWLRSRSRSCPDPWPPAGRAWDGRATPSVRLLRVVLVASVAAVATLALLPTLPDHLPPAIGDRGNQLRLAAYELSLVLPLAALGFVLTYPRSEGSRRTTLVLLGLWAATVPIAIAVSALLPTPIKLFRVAPFALGVPALVTLGLVTVANRAGSRLGRGGAVIGALVLAGGLALGERVAGVLVRRIGGGVDRGADGAVADRGPVPRRDLLGPADPVIFLTQGNPRLLDRAVRSAVPPDLIPDTWVFVGRPDDLAARGPVDDPDRPRLSALAQKWWAAAWPNPSQVFDRDPIVIRIGPAGSTPAGGIETGGVELAPGVEVLAGPRPASIVRAARAVPRRMDGAAARERRSRSSCWRRWEGDGSAPSSTCPGWQRSVSRPLSASRRSCSRAPPRAVSGSPSAAAADG